jgi:acetyl-CoA carboxylase carboxyl transferase subunit beta
MRWFHKPKYATLGETRERKKDVPPGLWTKCPRCEELIFNKDLEANLKVCPRCGEYFRLSARERIASLVERDTFQEFFGDLESLDPIGFPEYAGKLVKARNKTNLPDAILTGRGVIGVHPVALGVSDFQFMAGSMGSVVGEKVTRIAEYALEHRLPLVVVSAGGGGARMQESMLSLMQMAKTSAAVAKLRKNSIPYISVITHPTMGGVSASYASLGDVILAEPKALSGFAGPRVIEQTIGQRLPPGFQSSEFLLEHGMLDAVVERKNLKATVVRVLDHLAGSPGFRRKRSKGSAKGGKRKSAESTTA